MSLKYRSCEVQIFLFGTFLAISAVICFFSPTEKVTKSTCDGVREIVPIGAPSFVAAWSSEEATCTQSLFYQSSLSPEKGIRVTWLIHCSLKIRKKCTHAHAKYAKKCTHAKYPCPWTLRDITAFRLTSGIFNVPTQSSHIQHGGLEVKAVSRRFS